MNFREESPIVTSKTLAKVEETITRSQQAVGLPDHYLRRPASVSSTSDDGAHPELLVLQIKDLNTKLKTVEYLKTSYEKTVTELRDKIKDLEEISEQRDDQVQELLSVNEALKAEKAAKTLISSREAALQQRVDEQDRRIKELERLLRGHTNPNEVYIRQIEELEAQVERLTLENHRLQGKIPSNRLDVESNSRVDALERRIEALDGRCRQQNAVNEELQKQLGRFNSGTPVDFTKSETVTLNKFEEKMRKNTERIEEIEDKIERTTALYEELRIHISRSPTNYQDSSSTPLPLTPRKDIKRKSKVKPKSRVSKH